MTTNLYPKEGFELPTKLVLIFSDETRWENYRMRIFFIFVFLLSYSWFYFYLFIYIDFSFFLSFFYRRSKIGMKNVQSWFVSTRYLVYSYFLLLYPGCTAAWVTTSIQPNAWWIIAEFLRYLDAKLQRNRIYPKIDTLYYTSTSKTIFPD